MTCRKMALAFTKTEGENNPIFYKFLILACPCHSCTCLLSKRRPYKSEMWSYHAGRPLIYAKLVTTESTAVFAIVGAFVATATVRKQSAAAG